MQSNPWMDVFAYIVQNPVSFVGFAAVTGAFFAKGLRVATWTMTIFTVGVIAVSSFGGTQFVGGVITGVIANEITRAVRSRNVGA